MFCFKGTIYKQPGHEAYNKWGELLKKNEKNNDISDKDSDTFLWEFDSKGFVKFHITLQSKGDKGKVR